MCLFVCLSVSISVHVRCSWMKEVSDPPKRWTDLQALVSCRMWLLSLELRSFVRSVYYTLLTAESPSLQPLNVIVSSKTDQASWNFKKWKGCVITSYLDALSLEILFFIRDQFSQLWAHFCVLELCLYAKDCFLFGTFLWQLSSMVRFHSQFGFCALLKWLLP